jgi:hypothetical protein
VNAREVDPSTSIVKATVSASVSDVPLELPLGT